MMPARHGLAVHRLETAVAALYRGDWRTAWILLLHGGLAIDRQDLIDVAVCLRCVTRGLQAQSVHADVEAASYQIDTAAAVLRRYPRAQLVAEPPHIWRIDHLLWITSWLVQRERADLDAIRRTFGDLARGRPELVQAGVEYLTFVAFDPFTVRIHPLDRELTGLDIESYSRWRTGNRKDMCVRASRLRQFADVRNGPVSDKTWQRMGGYPGLREQALRTLAAEPLTRGRADLSVRLGRLRAWEYARAWIGDTAA